MTIDEARDWTSSAFADAIGAVQVLDYRAVIPWVEAILVLIVFLAWRRAARQAKSLRSAIENLSAELDAATASLDSEIAWRQAAERIGVQRAKEHPAGAPSSD